MINLENKVLIRAEKNGINVYRRMDDSYTFYEGLNKEDVLNKTIAQVEEFLLENTNRISQNIKYQYPFKVNWLIDERCNLDCIYCFADDKMKCGFCRQDILNTANHITSLNIMTVGLSGGEPTLNPFLKEAILSLKDKCFINLDTNGVSDKIGEIVQILKEAHVLVRITIDSIDPKILRMIRPFKNNGVNNMYQLIENNIKILKENAIEVMVHTVITQFNKDDLVSIGNKLIELGITTWQLYGVNYSQKCAKIYDSIKVGSKEIKEIYDKLKMEFNDKLNISVYYNEENFSSNAVLLIDSSGKFFVDSIFSGITYIGSNARKPSAKEISNVLNTNLHCKGYLE